MVASRNVKIRIKAMQELAKKTDKEIMIFRLCESRLQKKIPNLTPFRTRVRASEGEEERIKATIDFELRRLGLKVSKPNYVQTNFQAFAQNFRSPRKSPKPASGLTYMKLSTILNIGKTKKYGLGLNRIAEAYTEMKSDCEKTYRTIKQFKSKIKADAKAFPIICLSTKDLFSQLKRGFNHH